MKKKLALNTSSALLLQAVTIVVGFIVPRLILGAYGSAVNGLVHSITQFLGIITLLDLGVGQVIQSSLYKPLHQRDHTAISKILASGGKFFRRIAFILLVYVFVLMVVYPVLVNENFGWAYTAALIGAISISSFAQYYFGIIDRVLLSADQRAYIQNLFQIGSLLLHTVASVILITSGASIQMVKLVSSLIFCLRPLVMRIYVNRKYRVNRKISYEGEPIKQKWNGAAQHLLAFVLDGTDNIVLTVCSTLANVSIYSVYNMVVYGIRGLYASAIAGLHATVGELWAREDHAPLNRAFEYIELTLHSVTVFLFSCTGILVVPFVQVYTKGVTDANYVQPEFAVLLTLANAICCLKSNYNMVILAAGHYKQTQRCHMISALLNIVISIVGVFLWGLIGVALGTVISMLYQMVWMAIYDAKHLIPRPVWAFVKQFAADLLAVGLIVLATSWIELGAVTYLAWVIMAVKVAVIAGVIVLAVNFLFYRKTMIGVCRMALRKG